jgi:hypothetical protein
MTRTAARMEQPRTRRMGGKKSFNLDLISLPNQMTYPVHSHQI